ncbi:MAG: toll/interleukin-1 receptor domain-containing protein [Verrucomicrobia bacterium]|nr:toll/interleukin-1 receptor domain-containing protein [Verrucomicrobiota bacterium]
MTHDVFISHAHKDKRIADAICEKLEAARVKCWIADRDISPGEDWTEATRRAIGSSRVMVLVLSENANTSPHVEREIAHAFYTNREIIPVRLTQAPPRRDFLFYLGNVRWFDAFSPPAEQHLDALTNSVTDLVVARSVSQSQTPLRNASPTKAPTHFSDSWIGALRASHYGTLGMLKRVAIAFSILAGIWMVWFVFWQPKPEESLEENDPHTMNLGSRNALDTLPRVLEDPSSSQPTYTYTRFGLWVPNTGSSRPVQQGPQDPASRTAAAPPPPSPPSGDDRGETVDAESLPSRETPRTRHHRESLARTRSRKEVHRGKSQHRVHNEQVRPPDEPLAEIKRRLIALWHQMVTLAKESGDR